jgi:hypothetical protein
MSMENLQSAQLQALEAARKRAQAMQEKNINIQAILDASEAELEASHFVIQVLGSKSVTRSII